MLILGLDLSLTSTGLARVDLHTESNGITTNVVVDAIDLATVKSKATADKSYAAMSARIETISRQVMRAADPRPDLVVIEGPAFGAKGAHTHSRDWLWGKVFDGVRTVGVPIVVVTPTQRCKYATGRGNADKDTVLAAAIRRWPEAEIQGNDTADALILAAIGARSMSVPFDTVPVAHWKPVMEKLAR